MDRFFYRLENGILNLWVHREHFEQILYFNGIGFEFIENGEWIVVSANYELTELHFDTDASNKPSVVELKNEDTEIFYLKMNDESIVQITEMPVNGEITQYIRHWNYKNKNIPTPIKNTNEYELAKKHYSEAELCDDIDIGSWR